MPLQKILAPFLPGTPQSIPKNDDYVISKEQVLSPTLPFSPSKNNTHYGDPVIGLSTVDEDSSSARSNDTEDCEVGEFINNEENNLSTNTCEPNEQNALVLHEHPTSFELHDNDVMIEPVSEVIEEGYFDQDMMRSSTSSLAMYQPPHIKAGIDFSPPAEFLAQEEDTILEESPATMILSSSPVKPNGVRTSPALEELVEPLPAELIRPTYTDPMQDVFCSPMSEQPSHFAMETSFRKSESDFKSKCMKMIRNAKGLVCKPESPKNRENMKAKLEKTTTHPRAALRPIDTSLKAAEELKEEEVPTPIYKRHHTVRNSTTNLPNFTPTAPTAPYKSPIIGSDAYDIKLLCEQSFFGC